MKNILLLSLIVLFVSPVFAQSRIPKKVKEAFEKMVPEATDVKWSTPQERELAKERKYTANYNIGNDSLFSRFDYKGNWMITVTFMDIDKLPEAVTSSINNEYTDAKLTIAARMEQPGFDGYGVIYTYKQDQWTVQISKEGKIIRRRVRGEGFKFD